jgi:HEAT repeats
MFDSKWHIRASIQAALAAVFAIGSPLFGADEKGPKVAELPFRRMDKSTEDELRQQLAKVPELGFTQTEVKRLYTGGPKRVGGDAAVFRLDVGPFYYEKIRLTTDKYEFHSLPWLVRADCRISESSAETLNTLSKKMRATMIELSNRGAAAIDPKRLKEEFAKILGDEPAPSAVPTLMQLLQAEPAPIRTVLVETLGRIKGPDASAALVRRAVFDLSPEVREVAVRSLKSRPATEYADPLVSTLRYPWPPAAYHAAEAIAFLDLKSSAEMIDAISREADPRSPSLGRGTMERAEVDVSRELVRVNHLCNCLLCHAPSRQKTDPVRGRVPTPGEALPSLYYASQDGIFARADVTFLRQDFSVTQPVDESLRNNWPAEQRYDYMVRQRKVANPAAARIGTTNAPPKTPSSGAGEFDLSKLPDPDFNQKAALFALLAVQYPYASSETLADPRKGDLSKSPMSMPNDGRAKK